MRHFYFFLLFLYIVSQNLFAGNELTVKVPDVYYSKPGYLHEATLVVEPHGGYCEQSLYLEYTDNNQFSGYSQVEVIHRFELPQGAVVNDLWLWIGDSVMQAIMLDTWTARSIYDSIVSMKRDPAFLTKKGNQYELHIFPLTPGEHRKIKLNYITPTRWIGDEPFIELPLPMLKSDNRIKKTLNVLFKVKDNIWGTPLIKELPLNSFNYLKDTLGLEYLSTVVEDLTPLNSFNLNFNINMIKGTYFDSDIYKDSLNYFQLALKLKDIFDLKSDTTAKKVMVGIDLSGSRNKNFETLLPNVKKMLTSALKPDDSFNIIVSGAGKDYKLRDNWTPASADSVENVLNNFFKSPAADSISQNKLPVILFADAHSSGCWQFSDIEDYAGVIYQNTLYDSRPYYRQTDIIASYEQGYENVPSQMILPDIIASLDTFLLGGGTFLTYYDFNRDYANEPVASHYIDGLSTKIAKHETVTLYRNLEGNIGSDFPETVEHAGTYFFQYTDPDVKVELRDSEGNPAVISKKIGRGLVVVSGMWQFNDDNALKRTLTVPLMGLLKYKTGYAQLPGLYTKIKEEYISDKFNEAIVISNGDSLILQQSADNYADSFISGFGTNHPLFSSVNILNGVGPTVTVDDITYFGSGYLEQKISSLTGGKHFETSLFDWDYITSLMSSDAIPALEELTLNKSGDKDTSKIDEFRQIIQQPQDNNRPLFYIGSADHGTKTITFDLQAKFSGIDSAMHRTYTFPISYDTTRIKSILPSMVGNEQLKDFFDEIPLDTSKIVTRAMKYNLLCDFTALLALEPNDTIHFMPNPLDESEWVTDVENESADDTLQISVYPNPFNSQARIMVKVPAVSDVSVMIYNILGQKVKAIAEYDEVTGVKYYSWDGTDSHNVSVSSGVYLLRIISREKASAKESVSVHKMLMLK